MTIELTEEAILENIDELLTISGSIIETYYDMFYNVTPKDVTIQYYDNQGNLEEKIVPNRAKCREVGYSGEQEPEGYQTANVGAIYVQTFQSNGTVVKRVFIKTTATGNTGWIQLLSGDAIEAHNIDPDAHDGFLAKAFGDENVVFNVGDPVADSHAVNLRYVGALGNLNTLNKNDLVGAVNEVEANTKQLEREISSLTSAPIYCVNYGHIDSEGNADLIVEQGAPYYFYDKTPENYTDNSANFRTSSNFGDSQNTWAWGNSGAPFGADLGGGLTGYSYGYHPPNYNQSANGAFSENVGYAGKPIIHTFSPALPAGKYKFSCASNGYTYRLWYTKTNTSNNTSQTVEVSLPSLSTTAWTDVPASGYFTIPSGYVITDIRAEGTSNKGSWGIGPVHLIQYIENTDFENVIYFKVGSDYEEIICSDPKGETFKRQSIEPIPISSALYPDNIYNVMLPREGNAYLTDGNIFRQPNEPQVFTNNYTVNGTVNISSDYIASGFNSTGNGIVTTEKLANGVRPWYIEVAHETDTNGTGTIFGGNGSSEDYIPCVTIDSTTHKYMLYASSNGSSWNLVNGTASSYIVPTSSKEKFRTGWDGTKYYLDIYGYKWSNPTSLGVRFKCNSLSYGNDRYVAVGQSNNGNFNLYSYNGTTWYQGVMPDNSEWRSVAYKDGLFCAVSKDGKVAISTDGAEWSQVANLGGRAIKIIAGTNGFYIINNDSSDSKAKIYKSTKGYSWEIVWQDEVNANRLRDITFGDNKIIAITCSTGYQQSTVNMLTSTDGSNWTSTSITVGSGPNYYEDPRDISVACGDGKIVICKQASTTGIYVKSYNNGTWTDNTLSVTNGLLGFTVTFGDGKFLVTYGDEGSGSVSTYSSALSADGLTWAVTTSSSMTALNQTFQIWPANVIYINEEFFSIWGKTSTDLTRSLSYKKQWISDISVNSTTSIYQADNYLRFGTDASNPSGFYHGSIDLRNTYIHIGNADVWSIRLLQDGDIWVNTRILPLTVQKLVNGSWVGFNDVPIAKVSIEGGIVDTVETLQYNNRSTTIPNSTLPAYVVEAYSNGTEFYRVWSNGFIEQGGYKASVGTGGTTITFVKPFTSANYSIQLTPMANVTSFYGSKTNENVVIYVGSSSANMYWRACGY